MTDFLLWLYYTMTGINKTINRTIYSACFENILYMCGERACFPLPCLPAPLIPSPSPLMPSRTPHAFPAHGEGAPVLTPGRMRSRARTRANYYIESPCRPQGGRDSSQISCCFPLLVLFFLPYRSVNFLENEKKAQPGRASGAMRRPVGGKSRRDQRPLVRELRRISQRTRRARLRQGPLYR